MTRYLCHSCVKRSLAKFADKGYISKDLREKLQEDGVSLIYNVRKIMKPEPISDTDAAL